MRGYKSKEPVPREGETPIEFVNRIGGSFYSSPFVDNMAR